MDFSGLEIENRSEFIARLVSVFPAKKQLYFIKNKTIRDKN